MTLHGAIAAAVTPLTEEGASLDLEAFGPLVAFLAEGGIDGVLACGTTGEGVLLTTDERRTAVELFLSARPDSFQVAVHAGAQTTGETVALSRHAAEVGADAVAVIAPPYFPLDEDEILAHYRAAAQACAPLPLYVYEFAGRSGYAIPVGVVERLREGGAGRDATRFADAFQAGGVQRRRRLAVRDHHVRHVRRERGVQQGHDAHPRTHRRRVPHDLRHGPDGHHVSSPMGGGPDRIQGHPPELRPQGCRE